MKGPALYLAFPRGSAFKTFQTFQKGPALYLAFVFADAGHLSVLCVPCVTRVTRVPYPFELINYPLLELSAFGSYLPACHPLTVTRSLDFGDGEINKLISHLRPLLLSAGVDVELIPDQWTILKTELYTAGFSQGTFEKTWPTVNRMPRHRCPDVLDRFDALLTIPATTADCERGCDETGKE
ncbi:unnamed protein product [Boreogadus saida]